MSTKSTLTQSRGWTWFSFDVKNWLTSKDVLNMSSSEEGLYIRLLAFQWDSSDGTIPADPRSLSKLIGRDKRAIEAFITKWGSRLFPTVGDEAQQLAAIGGKVMLVATDSSESLRIVADGTNLRNQKLFYLAVSKGLPCVFHAERRAQSRHTLKEDSNRELEDRREELQSTRVSTASSTFSTLQFNKTSNNKSDGYSVDAAAVAAPLLMVDAKWLANAFSYTARVYNSHVDTNKFGEGYLAKWTEDFEGMLHDYRGDAMRVAELMRFSQYELSGQQKYNLRPAALRKNLGLLEKKLGKFKQNHNDRWVAVFNEWLPEVGIGAVEDVDDDEPEVNGSR